MVSFRVREEKALAAFPSVAPPFVIGMILLPICRVEFIVEEPVVLNPAILRIVVVADSPATGCVKASGKVIPAIAELISVVASVQDSTAPEAFTPKGYSPALQFAPLAARAVAVLAFPITPPVTVRVEATVEEAFEINPPVNLISVEVAEVPVTT